MNTLIYIETKEARPLKSSLELISAAKEFGGGTALLIGKDMTEAANEISHLGIPTLVLDVDVHCQDEVLEAFWIASKETGSDLLLMSSTLTGKDLAPRLAARLGTGCVTDATQIKKDGQKIIFTRPAYGGTILEELVFAAGKKAVASVRGGSFPFPAAKEAGEVTVKAVKIADFAVRAKIKETVVELTEAVDLEGADVVVAGGKGCTDEVTFGLVKELAGILGGVVAVSRPAMEAGWASRAHQVGQSGKIVTPKLYIACGISGSMQHMSGMLGSGYIVAINKDQDAPIFEAADLGIVGRCEEVLPILISEIRSLKA
jgi:electron transfer flavoprotein alpha subunit